MAQVTTYEDQREAVIYGESTDLFEARDTAYLWHGGQWSALYSFASTEATVWSEAHREELVDEIEGCRASVLMRSKADSGEDLDALDNLLACVKALPAKQAA